MGRLGFSQATMSKLQNDLKGSKWCFIRRPDHATYVPYVLVPTSHAIVDYCKREAV